MLKTQNIQSLQENKNYERTTISCYDKNIARKAQENRQNHPNSSRTVNTLKNEKSKMGKLKKHFDQKANHESRKQFRFVKNNNFSIIKKSGKSQRSDMQAFPSIRNITNHDLLARVTCINFV